MTSLRNTPSATWIGLTILTSLMSISCLQREAIKVDPILEALATIDAKAEANVRAQADLDAKVAAFIASQESGVDARDIGKDAPGRDKNTTSTNVGWETVVLALGLVFGGQVLYIIGHRFKLIRQTIDAAKGKDCRGERGGLFGGGH